MKPKKETRKVSSKRTTRASKAKEEETPSLKAKTKVSISKTKSARTKSREELSSDKDDMKQSSGVKSSKSAAGQSAKESEEAKKRTRIPKKDKIANGAEEQLEKSGRASCEEKQSTVKKASKRKAADAEENNVRKRKILKKTAELDRETEEQGKVDPVEEAGDLGGSKKKVRKPKKPKETVDVGTESCVQPKRKRKELDAEVATTQEKKQKLSTGLKTKTKKSAKETQTKKAVAKKGGAKKGAAKKGVAEEGVAVEEVVVKEEGNDETEGEVISRTRTKKTAKEPLTKKAVAKKGGAKKGAAKKGVAEEGVAEEEVVKEEGNGETESEAIPKMAKEVASRTAKFVGAHMSISGGLDKAVKGAVATGSKAFALFLRSQRQWAAKPLEDKPAEQFRQACRDHDFPPHLILPHGSYLMNCGSPNDETLRKSREALADELNRCEKLGLTRYNFHPGSSCGQITVEECLDKIGESINKVHQQTNKVMTVIENMSCQGSTIGGRFEELSGIIQRVTDKSRIGVCLDTCHAFAAGFDLSTEAGYEKMMSDFDRIIGLKYLVAVHLNDSKGKVGSHLDRHENIGRGQIGLKAFQRLMNDSRFDNIPLILETPVEDGMDYSKEIKLLNSLIGKT
ncbi:apurinic-apyrimidinic endonuclease-like [Patiria miniata]|uniref:Xylose isomerase-like TIM barrel domain-containing protein n=1 Tax=Patiria miniata TaxID=46514 RepID=A0A914AKD6_PATMI|nr:apurinic-apyrimidinic endonuclease-like [Patiria miniata]XP_038064451.1 apurinic-apyrimidinic endonuclease-like [Patiria miniata]